MSRRVVRMQNGPPAGSVYIGRGTIVGNPFVIGRDGSRAEVIEKYEVWFQRMLRRPGFVTRVLAYVGDSDLACWCAPKPCHGDALKRWLDSLESGTSGA